MATFLIMKSVIILIFFLILESIRGLNKQEINYSVKKLYKESEVSYRIEAE